MNVQTSKRFRNSELQLGDSTWDVTKRSARVAHKSSNGGFHPNSPETPMDALFELFLFALDNGEFDTDQIKTLRERLK